MSEGEVVLKEVGVVCGEPGELASCVWCQRGVKDGEVVLQEVVRALGEMSVEC